MLTQDTYKQFFESSDFQSKWQAYKAAFGKDLDGLFGDNYNAKVTEFISIMFEMKNEADGTATKHKNEDFLKELDKDRKEKNCEYAVLVSLLEADNELYNGGIVDMSHRYPAKWERIPVDNTVASFNFTATDDDKTLTEGFTGSAAASQQRHGHHKRQHKGQ